MMVYGKTLVWNYDEYSSAERYDEYEPWKYECISVDDKDLEGVVERLSSIDFYWHTLSVKGVY